MFLLSISISRNLWVFSVAIYNIFFASQTYPKPLSNFFASVSVNSNFWHNIEIFHSSLLRMYCIQLYSLFFFWACNLFLTHFTKAAGVTAIVATPVIAPVTVAICSMIGYAWAHHSFISILEIISISGGERHYYITVNDNLIDAEEYLQSRGIRKQNSSSSASNNSNITNSDNTVNTEQGQNTVITEE